MAARRGEDARDDQGARAPGARSPRGAPGREPAPPAENPGAYANSALILPNAGKFAGPWTGSANNQGRCRRPKCAQQPRLLSKNERLATSSAAVLNAPP